MPQEVRPVFSLSYCQKQTKWQQFSELLFIRAGQEYSQRSLPRRIFIHWCINICLPAVRLESPENKDVMVVKVTARYGFPHCPTRGTQTIWFPCPAENRVMSAHYKGNTWWSLPSSCRFPQSCGFHPDELVDLWQLCFILSYLSFSLYDSILVMIWFACCFSALRLLFVNYPSPPDVPSFLQLRIVSTIENAITAGNCLRRSWKQIK